MMPFRPASLPVFAERPVVPAAHGRPARRPLAQAALDLKQSLTQGAAVVASVAATSLGIPTIVCALFAVSTVEANAQFALPEEATINVDLLHTHSFSGLGMQVWPSSKFHDQRVLVLRNLGVRFVRLGESGKVPDGALAAARSVRSILSAYRAEPKPVRIRSPCWHPS